MSIHRVKDAGKSPHDPLISPSALNQINMSSSKKVDYINNFLQISQMKM